MGAHPVLSTVPGAGGHPSQGTAWKRGRARGRIGRAEVTYPASMVQRGAGAILSQSCVARLSRDRLVTQSPVIWNKEGPTGAARPGSSKKCRPGSEVPVQVDSWFHYCIVECQVCRSREGKQLKKPSREGPPGTVYVTVRMDPSEALARGLERLGERTSAGPAILSPVVSGFSADRWPEGLDFATRIELLPLTRVPVLIVSFTR